MAHYKEIMENALRNIDEENETKVINESLDKLSKYPLRDSQDWDVWSGWMEAAILNKHVRKYAKMTDMHYSTSALRRLDDAISAVREFIEEVEDAE